MSTGHIVALCFVLFSIAVLLFLIFGKASICHTKFRNHVIATAGVYVSGTVLIAALFFFYLNLPLVFVLISDIFVTVIFIFMSYMIIRLGNNLEDIRQELQEKNEEDKTLS